MQNEQITIKYSIANNMRLVQSYIENGVLINILEENYKVGDYICDKYNNHLILQEDFYAFNQKADKFKIGPEHFKRKLSISEINDFNELLAKYGYKYLVNENRMLKLKERVKKGETFYCISRTFEILESKDNRDTTSDKLHLANNYFTNRTNAEIKVKEILTLINK